MLAAALSLGVEGGEQRGDPAAITFIGAFLDPSLGDVMEAAAAVEVTTEAGFVAGKCLASRRMHRGSRATHRADPPATKAEQKIMKNANEKK
jgi:hypothetical protein